MTSLYLVRHGETDWNAQRRIQGSTDIPLNDTGRAQAETTGAAPGSPRLGWHLLEPAVARVRDGRASSPGRSASSRPSTIAAIVERNYGDAEGLNWERDREPVSRRHPRARARDACRGCRSRGAGAGRARGIPPGTVAHRRDARRCHPFGAECGRPGSRRTVDHERLDPQLRAGGWFARTRRFQRSDRRAFARVRHRRTRRSRTPWRAARPSAANQLS